MEADAEEDAAAGEDEVGVEVVELVELDEQPATARSDRVTAPETPPVGAAVCAGTSDSWARVCAVKAS